MIATCASLLGLVGMGVGALMAYGFFLAVYRLFFHPLAKYPGPVVARVTGLYQLYHAWKGDRHLDFYKLHEKYGPIVRYGPNSLAFNSSAALRQIYGFKANVAKAEFYDAFVHPAANTHNSRDRVVHARKRRVLSHAFSMGALKEMERYILDAVRIFCAQVGNRMNEKGNGWSEPRNMADWTSYLAMDILGDLAFGKAFHMLEQEDNRYALDLVSAAAKRHLICGTMPIIDKLKLDKILFPQVAAGRAKYMTYSRAQLMERTQLGDDTDRRDFFYHLLNARDPETGQGFSTPELWGESNLLIIAGSDTTSTAISATLFYLTRSPVALATVTKEVRSMFSDIEEIVQGPTLNSCVFLRACIDEAMRMSPSVGGLLPREVLAGGFTVDGHFIPPDTVIGTPHYAIHHNESYYRDAFEFIPERWIVGAANPATGRVFTEAEVHEAQNAFCPFSIGPRGCIGKGLAYIEMMITLARLMYLYDMRKSQTVTDLSEGRADGDEGRRRCGEFQLVDTFTSLKEGPMVEFRRV